MKRLHEEVEEDAKDPESTPYFVITNDRYYYGMWCMPIPEALCRYGAKNGDLVILAQRKLDTLTEWTVKLRFRYHLGANPEDPYSLEDKKHWSAFAVDGSEAELDFKVREVFRGVAFGASMIGGGVVHVEPPDFLELKCQGDDFGRKVMAANKDWLHMKTADQLEKDKYFTRREQSLREDALAEKVEKTKPGVG